MQEKTWKVPIRRKTRMKHVKQPKQDTLNKRVNWRYQDNKKRNHLTRLLLFAGEEYETDAKVHWMYSDPKSTIYRHGFVIPQPCLFPKPERKNMSNFTWAAKNIYNLIQCIVVCQQARHLTNLIEWLQKRKWVINLRTLLCGSRTRWLVDTNILHPSYTKN